MTREGEPWFVDPAMVVLTIQRWARDLDREADRLRALAAKIANPPEGVTVELNWNFPQVTFVGPPVEDANSQEQPTT